MIRRIFLLWLWLTLPTAVSAAPLEVGIKPAPPFVMQDENGKWTGISIELWRAVADELGIEYSLQPYDLDDLLLALESGSVDVGVGALTVTAEREARFDFSHGFYLSGLGIGVDRAQGGWWSALSPLYSLAFLKVIAGLAVMLLAVGLLVWWFERRRNPEQFGGQAPAGIGSGFWWAAVTMTTVGYGDKAPRTLGGRLIGVLWMFTSLLIVSGFTAAIASALTVGRLDAAIAGPEDLHRHGVASVTHSASAAWLEREGIGFRGYPDITAAVTAVLDGSVDAVVYDMPILRHIALRDDENRFRVLPRRFEQQNYAFAVPAGSQLRESLDRALLRNTEARAWEDTLKGYLGADQP